MEVINRKHIVSSSFMNKKLFKAFDKRVLDGRIVAVKLFGLEKRQGKIRKCIVINLVSLESARNDIFGEIIINDMPPVFYKQVYPNKVLQMANDIGVSNDIIQTLKNEEFHKLEDTVLNSNTSGSNFIYIGYYNEKGIVFTKIRPL